MKISAQMSVVLAAIFATACFSVAITGFSGLGSITDPVQASDASGYAWFWTFLGTVAALLGAVGWWIARTKTDEA